MFEKNPRMNSLESRKQLLIAESELNRAQLAGDMAALMADVRMLTDRAKSFSSIASSAAVLVAGLAAFRRGKPVDADAKPSRLQTILKGAGLISTLWLAFRPRSKS
jgi:non-ribosomal peptide synthetase component F